MGEGRGVVEGGEIFFVSSSCFFGVFVATFVDFGNVFVVDEVFE